MSAVNDLCSVERKCSSTGRACTVDDRACQSEAIAQGLEVACERASEPRSWIYCPPGGQQRDSSVVWILLAIALGVAAIGGIISVRMFRNRLKSDDA